MHAKRRCFFGRRARAGQGSERATGRRRGGDRLLVPQGRSLHRRQLAAGGRRGARHACRLVARQEAGHRPLAPRLGRAPGDRAGILSLLQDRDESGERAEVSDARTSAVPFAIASAAACGIGLLAALFFFAAPARGPAVYGAAAAALGAVCAFTALVRATGKGTNALLAGFTIGFLCRVALVAVGLVASG